MSKFLPNVAKLVSISSILFAGVMLATPQVAVAAYDIPTGGVELEGFAWSGYTSGPVTAGVGWISVNCSNTGTCGASNYAVSLESSGNLSGYAWASNVQHPVTGASLGPGWINFDPAGPYPSGAGTSSAQATGGSFTGNLHFGGWARFCAAAANPASCSGGTNPASGGWDGWVSLAGSSFGGYGITMTPTGAANGASNYAWGGPLVVGWIDFSPDGYAPVSYTTIPPVVNILTPTSPQPIGPVTITFDPTGGGGGGAPDTCTYSDDGGATTNSLSPPFTNIQSFVVDPGTDTTYIVTCENPEGASDDTVDVEFFSDLILGAVNTTPGTINAVGDYDTVDFVFAVSGVLSGFSNVPYTVDLGGTSINGTFDGSSAVGGVVTISETFTNVPYSATPVGWTVVVDPTSAGQPNGVVNEGGGAAAEISNNEKTGTLSLPAPPPTITIDVDSIVRTGTVANVDIEVSSVGPSTCEVFGPGITGEPAATFTVAAGTTENVSLNTSPLNNRAVIAIECTVDGGSPVREGASIEVTPSFQEI